MFQRHSFNDDSKWGTPFIDTGSSESSSKKAHECVEVFKNGIWRNPLEKEIVGERTEEEITDKNDNQLRFFEKKLKELSNKEYLSPDDLQEKMDL